MYWHTNYDNIKKNNNYKMILKDLNEVHTSAFFTLGSSLVKVPNVRLGKRKKHHRIGTMKFLFKFKNWKKVREEGMTWQRITWRPLLSYQSHLYRRWYSFAGRALTAMAKINYYKGDMVESSRGVAQKIAKMNKLGDKLVEKNKQQGLMTTRVGWK